MYRRRMAWILSKDMNERVSDESHPYLSVVADKSRFLHPLLRILWALGFMVPIFAVNKLFKLYLLARLGGSVRVAAQYTEAVVFFCLFIYVYRLYVAWIEKRRAVELSSRRAVVEIGRGLLLAAGMVGLTVAVLAALGCYTVAEVNSNQRLMVDYLAKFTMGAFLEELLFRLILFRLTEEWLGSWWALATQVALFGLAHIANDNATVLTCLCVAVVGGLVYTAAFMYTHRIWFALGIHAGWNYLQSGIFGMPTSGSAYEGVLLPKVTGPRWLTGGNFGIEASVLGVGLCLIVGIAYLIKAKRFGNTCPARWKRNADRDSAAPESGAKPEY
jgi:membrane protease YdiL (CAAX protease family)